MNKFDSPWRNNWNYLKKEFKFSELTWVGSYPYFYFDIYFNKLYHSNIKISKNKNILNIIITLLIE